MSQNAEFSGMGVDRDDPVPDSGAAVLRFRTRSGTDAPGHALLIGSPLGELGGVARCLRCMAAWLEPTYDLVGGPVDPTKAGIEAMVEELVADVEPGDQVLVYYAGHGKQGLPAPEVHDRPVTVLLPIDACESTPAATRLIPGNELVGWLDRLADACDAPKPGPRQRSRRRDEVESSVTMIFECCHSEGAMDSWPDSAVDCEVIVETIGRQLEERRVRGASDPLSRVVRVMASGRDEWAQGPTTNDVGLMTEALVELLERYPDEPWWAVMDRLQAQWKEVTQYPRIAGPDGLVPLTGRRIECPEDLWPCERLDAERWHCALGKGGGRLPGQRVMLTSSLALPPQVEGRYERVGDDLAIRVCRAADALLVGDFAWATRPSLGRRAVVDVRGGRSEARRALIERLRACAKLVRDRGEQVEPKSGPGVGPEPSWPAGELAATTFELQVDGVVLRDGWGDAVARTGIDDRPRWDAWLDRLVSLDDWLHMEREVGDWPAGAFALRWGTWSGGQRQEWGDEPRVLNSRTPLWVEFEAALTCVPAFVSLFRVRADRVVEALTPHMPGGLPATGRYPLVGWRDESEAMRLTWPTDLPDDEARCELLVAMVSDRPLPLVRLRRGAVARKVARGPEPRGGARLGMMVLRYRLVDR